MKMYLPSESDKPKKITFCWQVLQVTDEKMKDEKFTNFIITYTGIDNHTVG
jgi:hypothetical protein